MTTALEQQVSDLARRVQYASADEQASLELAIEVAVLAATADAQRVRPANLPSYLREQPAEQVAEVRARTLRDWVALRAQMLAASLSTAELAKQLGMSSAAVTKRRQAERLVAFQDRGDWRYPAWQLRGGALLPGVEQVWQALPRDVHDRLSLAHWFTLESRHLGTTPREALEAGEVERVVDAASYVGGM